MADNAVTSTSTNIYWIKPLTGPENYAMWKIKMIDILTGQDLWEYVDGTTTLPSDLAAQLGWCKTINNQTQGGRQNVGVCCKFNIGKESVGHT